MGGWRYGYGDPDFDMESVEGPDDVDMDYRGPRPSGKEESGRGRELREGWERDGDDKTAARAAMPGLGEGDFVF